MKKFIIHGSFLTILSFSLHAADCNKQSIHNASFDKKTYALLFDLNDKIKAYFEQKNSILQKNIIVQRVDKKAFFLSGICGWVALNLCLKSRFHLKNTLLFTGSSIILPYAMIKQKNKKQ